MQQLAQYQTAVANLTRGMFGMQASCAAQAAMQPPIQIAGFGVNDIVRSAQVDQFLTNAAAQVQPFGKEVSWDHVVFSWPMDVLLLHEEIPDGKCCQDPNYQSQCCGIKKSCVCCLAIACNAEQAKYPDITSVVNTMVSYLQANKPAIDNMTPKEAVFNITEFLVGQQRQFRKTLSMFGAVRVPKERAKTILASKESLNNYWSVLTSTTDNKMAYMLYHDYGNAIMGAWTETIGLPNVEGFNSESKGDIVECMLALGWVHINGQPDVKAALSFVTKMVPWIEQGLDEFMINSNGVIPIPVVAAPVAQPQQQDDRIALVLETLKTQNDAIQAAIKIGNDTLNEVRAIATRAVNAAPAQMEVEVKATINVPKWTDQRKRDINPFLQANGNNAWLENPALLDCAQPKWQAQTNSMQSAIFRSLRDGQFMDPDGSNTKVSMPNFEGWYPWKTVKAHIEHDEIFGDCTDEIFWKVVVHTINRNDPKHSSYMVADVVYSEGQQDGTKKDQHYVLIKVRELPGGASGSGAGWPKNWGQPPAKRQNKGWQNYPQQQHH